MAGRQQATNGTMIHLKATVTQLKHIVEINVSVRFQITSSCAVLSHNFHCVLEGCRLVSIQSQCHHSVTLVDSVLCWVEDHLHRVFINDVNSGSVSCSLGDALGGGCWWDGQNCREVLSEFSSCVISDGDEHRGCCLSSQEGCLGASRLKI